MIMTGTDKDEFNETLKRMMDAKPKPHEEMKKDKDGRSPSAHPKDGKRDHNKSE